MVNTVIFTCKLRFADDAVYSGFHMPYFIY